MDYFDLTTIRDVALGRRVVDLSNFEALLSRSEKSRARYLSHAWSVIAQRALLALVPRFPRSYSYNQRKKIITRLVYIQGLGETVTDSELDSLVELSSRITDYMENTKKSSWADIHYKTKQELLLKQNHRCIVCGTRLFLGEPRSERSPELDHTVPFALGGNVDSNTRIICKACNGAKADDLSYVSVGRMSTNDVIRPAEKRRLFYWKLELAGSKCQKYGCDCTSHDARLLLERIHPNGSWNFDNVDIVCVNCAEPGNRYPDEVVETTGGTSLPTS
ncbi:HNH endonuclease [Paraburkholderia domus]|uniref:HNH nuclease domain-containing protein n=1 Tax=Paraburkholderia domus TaxID=2793075 RepID=A0A9N8QTP5_9BURK|nr:HNH endonuclease signature motif containing protein [Paraburkholderia domus]MBK5163803.1 HNH endonuclease [Burkholderia sp. R-70211]CAE6858415.1 hypothetical protein R70211_00309 [Paraburkholderia domus]